MLKLLPASGLTITLLIGWQMLTKFNSDYLFLLGSPVGIANEFPRYILQSKAWKDIFYTLSACILGLSLGTFLGIVVGTLISISKNLDSTISPLLTVFSSVPLVVFAPMFILWFGIDWSAKVYIAAFSSFFIACRMSSCGAAAAINYVDYSVRFLASNSLGLLWWIALPGSVGWVVEGLKLNVGTALVAVIIGEFINSQLGLGHALLNSSSLYQMNEMWCVIIVLAISSCLLNALITFMQRKLRFSFGMGENTGSTRQVRSDGCY